MLENYGELYGQRLRGFFKAPATGTYYFYIASDDSSDLFLTATGENPANKTRIAYVNGAVTSRNYTAQANQKSAAISLTAGQRYYIEALHKEGGGGDHLSVGVDLPGGTQKRPIPISYLDPYSSATPPTPANTVMVAATTPLPPENGPGTGVFTLTRTGSTVAALTVSFEIGGTAALGGDYQAFGLSATIPAGSASTTVAVTAIDDPFFEPDETVTLTLASAPAKYITGGSGTATVTIQDNDIPLIGLTATDNQAAETGGNSGVFTFTRSGDSRAVVVWYSIGGTATNGSDYPTLTNSVTIPAGQASITRTITPISDSIYEGAETVVLTLSNDPDYAINTPTATVTITADPGSSTLLWDANGAATGTGGTGTWNMGGALWRNGADTGALQQWTNPAGIAEFAGTVGTVTLDTSLGAVGLVFETPGYTVAGSGILSLGAAGINATALTTGTVTITNAITFTGNQTWNVGSGGTLSSNGEILGNYDLAKMGSGTVTLSGANSYSGATTVGGGVLELRATGALGNTASVTVLSGAALVQNGINVGNVPLFLNGPGAAANIGALATSGGAVSYGGVVTLQSPTSLGNTGNRITLTNALNGAFALTKIGNNILVLGSDTNGTTTTTISQGTVQVGNGGTTGALGSGAVTLATGTNLQFFRTNAYTVSNIISGAGTLKQIGSGTVTLSAANSYTGATTVASGVLRLGTAGALGNGTSNTASVTVLSGAALDVAGINATASVPLFLNGPGQSASVGALTNSAGAAIYPGPVTLQSATSLGNTGNRITLTNALNGAFALTKIGNNILVLGSDINGTTTTMISQGTVQVGNGGTTGALGGGAVTLATGTNLQFFRTNAYTVSNIISGAGTLTQIGSGTVTLSAANSYTGATTISSGALLIANGTTGSATGTGSIFVAAGATLGGSGTATGAVTAAGSLSPGNAIGTIRLGNTTLSGNYSCEVNGSEADHLIITGNVNLTGATLNVLPTGAGLTQNSYVIGSWTGTRTGAFASVTGLPAGYELQYDNTNKQILLGTLPGFSSWVAGFPDSVDLSREADSDVDGICNTLEYVLGGDLIVMDTTILPTQRLTETAIEFSFKRRDASENDTTLVVQWSTDMEKWNDIPVHPSPAANVTITENDEADDDVKVIIPRDSNTGMFVRLKATQ